MNLHAVLVRVLAALTFGLVWLLAACAWVLQPVSRELRWAGLLLIGCAVWVQHRPRGSVDPRP